ncbi:MAG: DNA modification methylase [Planctomycetes bacterium]|nr:DNA modification methylase [Planctomycetota bacterium]
MDASPELVLRRVPLGELHLDAANARLHDERNLASIKASLQRFGQAEPLVVQRESRRVIGGNGRLEAMRSLGWTECDVVELDLDETAATALGIALNRTAELAEWDPATLGRLLDSLRDEGALEGVGFDEGEIDEILAGLLEGGDLNDVEDPGPGELPEDPITMQGDLWILGDHRLLCGDSTCAEDLARLMAGERARLLATDPPYLVDYRGAGAKAESGEEHWDDFAGADEALSFFTAWLRVALPHCVPDVPVYQWHAHRRQALVERAWEAAGLLLHQQLIWVKARGTLGRSHFMWQHEPCFYDWPKGKMPTKTRRHRAAHGAGARQGLGRAHLAERARGLRARVARVVRGGASRRAGARVGAPRTDRPRGRRRRRRRAARDRRPRTRRRRRARERRAAPRGTPRDRAGIARRPAVAGTRGRLAPALPQRHARRERRARPLALRPRRLAAPAARGVDRTGCGGAAPVVRAPRTRALLEVLARLRAEAHRREAFGDDERAAERERRQALARRDGFMCALVTGAGSRHEPHLHPVVLEGHGVRAHQELGPVRQLPVASAQKRVESDARVPVALEGDPAPDLGDVRREQARQGPRHVARRAAERQGEVNVGVLPGEDVVELPNDEVVAGSRSELVVDDAHRRDAPALPAVRRTRRPSGHDQLGISLPELERPQHHPAIGLGFVELERASQVFQHGRWRARARSQRVA